MQQWGSRRIVVVDDECSIADTLAAIFRRSGYDARAAYDGASALELCADAAPDVLISDVMMPGINGIELAILVREQCPECHVILFSGVGISFSLVEEAGRRGHHFDILEKPIHPVALLEKVASALDDGSVVQFPKQAAQPDVSVCRTPGAIRLPERKSK